MLDRPRFIGSDIYRRSRYGGKHPLAIPRVSAAIDLCRALGWLPDSVYIDSPVATPDQLARFHDRDYIAAVMAAEAAQAVDIETRERYGLGINANPVFGEVFRRPATACGATLHAIALLAGGGAVYSPAGGTHHGRPARASGFCYFNDPALGILAALDAGLGRIVYVDIDAHHGDGVEDAFADEPRVTTISVHEAGRWPHTGLISDPARGIYNYPVPPDFNDSEFAVILEEGILPTVAAAAPDLIVLQGGADALVEDPLSRLALSNLCHRRTVAALRGLAPRLLVLGGGGYNPWAVARCWAGVWAALNEIAVPDRLPAPAEAVLRGLSWNRSAGRNPPDHWFTTLLDAPRPGPIRDAVRDLVRAAARAA
jgi:acetoin utilization protein AcuC